MTTALSPNDSGHLRATLAALSVGDGAGAVQSIRRVSPAAGSHPEVLLVAARLLAAQGRLADARRTLEAVTALMPADSRGWNALGNVLSHSADSEAAEAAYLRAVTLEPGMAEPWINLGLVRIDRRDFAGAREAAARAAGIAPHDPRPPQIEGLAARGEGAIDSAIRAFGIAHRLAPSDGTARHNLAESLRAADRAPEALALVETGLSLPPETRALRAHLLADLSRFDEAIASYRALILDAPGLVDAHETLARLLPQLGRGDEAFDSYASALSARPDDRALWISAVTTAKDLGDGLRLAEWSGAALARFGHDPLFALAQAIGLRLQHRHAEAIDLMRVLAAKFPDEAGISNHLAPSLLASGDWRGAEHAALTATRLAPLDQSGWAWLTVAWRLLGDAREEWLADYERLVLQVELPLNPAQLSQLASSLTALHVTSHHPLDQSPRNGSQTRGNLFDRRSPEVAALAATIRSAVEARLAGLRRDPAHPFRGRLAGGIAFAGSWSIRLSDRGFHQSHIHAMGWLSSALHIALPPEVASYRGGGSSPPGALAFGTPDDALGLALPPRRVVRPVVGTLVLFPSYIWHSTLPFDSTSPRLTVAFDALPSA